MPSDHLYAPWRMEYIRSIDTPANRGCFLCDAANAAGDAERRERLVLWTTELSLVLINRFPYTNGHLLIAPRAHIPELDSLSDEQACDMQRQTLVALKLLKLAISPQGFNVGINLGRCAGAGLPGHVHQHLVPRWGGDVNFISVVGEVRIVPQAVNQLYDELKQAFDRNFHP